MYGMELIEANANPDPMKSEVMSRAGELRSQGYDKSTALSMAWTDILGDDDYEDDDEEDDLYPVKKRRKSNPTAESSLPTIGIAAAGYLLWCFMASVAKGLPWTFRPWKTAPVGRRLIRQVQPQTQMGGSLRSMVPVYNAKNMQEESIQLIVP